MYQPDALRKKGSMDSSSARRIALSLVSPLPIGMHAFGSAGPESTPTLVTLTIGLPVQTGEDPLHGANQVARLLSFEGLSYLARDGRPHPRLAENWQESADGLTWVIRLRRDADFHDGSPVNAAAVKESLERSIASPERELSPGLADISAIETPNEFEIKLQLHQRSTFVLDSLTVAISKTTKDGKQVGTGPFLMNSAEGGQLVMMGVPRHYRGRPNINRIVMKTYQRSELHGLQ